MAWRMDLARAMLGIPVVGGMVWGLRFLQNVLFTRRMIVWVKVILAYKRCTFTKKGYQSEYTEFAIQNTGRLAAFALQI